MTAGGTSETPVEPPPGHVAPEHSDMNIGGHPQVDLPAAGGAVVRSMDWANGIRGPMLWFKCPRDRLYCGVPLKPSPPNSLGCAWDWDGNLVAPTVTPSVNCTGGCGWHGHITKGVVG